MNEPASTQRKVHLLGFGKQEYLRYWRPFSCDSSSWLGAARFGQMDVYRGGGKFTNVPKGRASWRTIEPLANRIVSYGFNPSDLSKAEAWTGTYGIASTISTCSWIDYSLDCWKNLGINVFLASSYAGDFDRAVKNFDRVARKYRDGAQGVNEQPKLRLLVAYPYFNAETARILAERGDDLMLLIDSGAFTAWKLGKPIALDDYCKFIETMPVKPWRYFQLDVIGDPDATVKNYDEMRRRGFDPIPIFTRGSDPALLDYFYAQTDLVGVGGLVQTRGNNGFVNGLMEHLRGKDAHLLGFTKPEALKFWKPFSCDCSSWSMGIRFAQIDLYRGFGHMDRFNRVSAAKKLDAAAIARLNQYGLDPALLRDPYHWTNRADTMLRRIPAYSWTDYALDAFRNLKTNIFLVPGSNSQLQTLIEAYLHIAPIYKARAA